MIDYVVTDVFSEETRKRISGFLFGEGVDYCWWELAQQYRTLEYSLTSRYDWIHGSASDTLAYLDTEDEKVLKMWIAEHPHYT